MPALFRTLCYTDYVVMKNFEESQMSKNNEEPQGQSPQVIHGGNVRRHLPKKLSTIVIVLIVSLLLVGGIIFLVLRNKKTPEPPVNNAQKSISYNYEESSSTEAYGYFLSATLESYKVGGNKNGIDVEGRGHYPTTEQVKNKEWARDNLKLDDGILRLIENESLVYTANGCEAEKCTTYTITVDGVEIAQNLN